MKLSVSPLAEIQHMSLSTYIGILYFEGSMVLLSSLHIKSISIFFSGLHRSPSETFV
jgi:hypothetical protein